MAGHVEDVVVVGGDPGHYGLPFREQAFDASGSPESQPSLYAQDSDVADNSSASSLDEATGHRLLGPGLYVPTTAFFDPHTEELDLTTTAKHAVRLAKAGVTGLVTQGSNGEAVHLSREERKAVTRATRQALQVAGYVDMPVIVGCGAQSTRETVQFCRDALDAGGDYALVLPPSYYRALFGPDSVVEFFTDVANASPLPILIYNYPLAVAGLDLDSDIIIRLSRHPNIVGCKLTCGNTGKLNRIVAATSSESSDDSDSSSHFLCFGGSADFTIQTLIGGGSGIIAGLANIAPYSCMELMQAYQSGQFEKASRLQALLARADWCLIQRGIIATKILLYHHYAYGGFSRKPLPRPSASLVDVVLEEMRELMALEVSLQS